MKNRNYGIDLLRVLVTLMVINLHLMLYGGLQERAVPLSGSYNALWMLAIASDCAVNCFGMISGYVSYGKRFNLKKLLRLHLTVLLYSLGITGIVFCVEPNAVSSYDLLRSIFPITMQLYWFYSAYALAFLVMPILNWVVKNCDKRICDRILLMVVILFSIIPTATGKDLFAINRGFSLPWMLVLFFTGMYLKKYNVELCQNKTRLVVTYLACVGITWFLKLGLELRSWLTYGSIMNTAMLTDYCSPTILFAAVALVQLFSTLEIPNWKHRVLNRLAPLCFSVYLIHEHPLVRKILIHNCMEFAVELPPIVQPLIVITVGLLVLIMCLCIDSIRMRMFQYLGIEKNIQ